MTQFVHKLARYPIPREVERLAANDLEAEMQLDELFRGEDSYLDDEDEKIDYPSHLTINNYAKCMQTLLWLEEAQMKGEIKE